MPVSGVATTRADRREELVDAAVRVIRREGPSASMETLAAEAGISKPILYRHFGDKGGLVEAVAGRFVGTLMADLATMVATSPPGRELVARTIDSYLGFVDREPEVWGFLNLGPPAEQVDAHQSKAGFVQRVGDQMATFFVSAGVDTERASVFGQAVVGLVQSVGDWWLAVGRQPPRERLVAHLTDLLWNGFANMTEDGNAG